MVDLFETGVGEPVGFEEVGRDVGVRGREGMQVGLEEFGVVGLNRVDGFGAERVGFEC